MSNTSFFLSMKSLISLRFDLNWEERKGTSGRANDPARGFASGSGTAQRPDAHTSARTAADRTGPHRDGAVLAPPINN